MPDGATTAAVGGPGPGGALAEYDDAHARDKSLYLSWLAGAYPPRGGEVEQAATVTARTLDLFGPASGSCRSSGRWAGTARCPPWLDLDQAGTP
ncbi:hypothetical protein ADK64_38210 [Streptomyces sp. MMG1121]|nr:hypothetical protein ADK64_38210 [Streptomyces sp. MMG1121]